MKGCGAGGCGVKRFGVKGCVVKKWIYEDGVRRRGVEGFGNLGSGDVAGEFEELLVRGCNVKRLKDVSFWNKKLQLKNNF